MGYFCPKGGLPLVQWELISVMKQLGLEPTNWMDAGRFKLIGTMQAEIKLHVARHGEAPVRRRNRDGTVQPLPSVRVAGAPVPGAAATAAPAPGAPPRTMTPPRRAAPAPKRRGLRHGVEAQERLAAQLVAAGEVSARRNIYIGETPPANFQPATFQTAASASAMGFSLTPEQHSQAAQMATAMEGMEELESEPHSEPSLASAMSSGVLAPSQIPVPNW